MKIPANSLLALSIESVGYIKTGRVLAVVLAWALAIRAHDGEWPPLEVRGGQMARVAIVVDYWRSSTPTEWRGLTAFRNAFPDEVDPTRIALIVLDQVGDRLEAMTDRQAQKHAPDLVGLVVIP